MLSLAPLLAQAQPAQSPLGGGSSIYFLIPIFFGIFYFMIIRPQRKQEADVKKYIDGLQKGDEVVTTGGMIGKVDKVQEGIVTLEVASGVRLRVMKSQVVGPYAPKVAAEEVAADKK